MAPTDSVDILTYITAATIIFIAMSTPVFHIIIGNKTREYGLVTSTDDGRLYASGVLLHSFIFYIFLLSITIENHLFGLYIFGATIIFISIV